MGKTSIFYTQDRELARRTAKLWLIENKAKGVVVAQTDGVRVADAAAPLSTEWETVASDDPWYVVLATMDKTSFATGTLREFTGDD